MGRPPQLERPRRPEPTTPARPDAPPRAPAPVPPAPSGPPGWRATARAVLPAFLVTRVVTLVAGVLGALVWGVHDGAATYDPAGLTTGLGAVGNRLVGPFARWDAVWFLDIANHGYPTSYLPRTAFFPLYPILLNVGGLLLGSPVVAGILISSVCAYLGAMVVHRLTELELGTRAAGVAVWALLAFPGSLWLTAVYSEGLFLLLSAACLLFAREGRWTWVAACGALAATTRSAGVLLVVPILVLAWSAHRARTTDRTPPRLPGAAAPAGRRPALPRELRPALLAAAATVGGLLLFVVGLVLAGHTWTVSFDQQQEWGRRNVGPIDGVVEAVRAAWTGVQDLVDPVVTPLGEAPALAWVNPLLLGFLVVGVAALVGAARRLPPAYAAYAGCALLLPLSSPAVEGAGPLMSLPRFLGVLFPLAMWAGWWLTRGRLQRTRQTVLLVAGLGLLALFSELTTRWLFVA